MTGDTASVGAEINGAFEAIAEESGQIGQLQPGEAAHISVS